MTLERSNFVIGVVVSLGALLFVSVSGGGIPPKMKCMDQEVDLTQMFKGFMECAQEKMSEEDIKIFKDPNTPEDKKKEIGMKAHSNLCIRVCQWKKHQQLLQEDGSLNRTSQDAFVDKAFPEGAREGLKTGLAKCHADNAQSFKDDGQCEGYKPFEDCLKKTYADVCKVDMSSIHMDSV